jgi:hypothetical protein
LQTKAKKESHVFSRKSYNLVLKHAEVPSTIGTPGRSNLHGMPCTNTGSHGA